MRTRFNLIIYAALAGFTAVLALPLRGATIYNYTGLPLAPYGISDNGDIVGSANFSSQGRALLDHNGLVYPIQAVSGKVSVAAGINSSGEIVGQYGNEGFTLQGWSFNGSAITGGTLSLVDFPGATYTVLRAVNNLGQAVGGYCTQPGVCNADFAGFLYANGSYTSFKFPGATTTDARGINSAGLITGDYNGGSHGFLYNPATNSWTSIDYPGAIRTHVAGINDAGIVVGDYTDASGNFIFLYNINTHTFTRLSDFPGDLDPTFSALPTAINASNDIAGFTSNRRLAGVDINNTTGGYLGIPVSPASPPSPPGPNIPEPGTFGLVILGMAVVAAGVRRWRTES